MTQDIKIKITNLTKIFGPKANSVLKHVDNGMTKDDLLKEHKHVLGLSNINLDLANKNIEVIMGLSGSGKSTLIRHINRLIEPTAGSVIIGGEDVIQMPMEKLRKFRQQKTAMVFQSFALLPHKTIMDNVCLGVHLQGVKGDEAVKRAKKWIDRVGLSGYEDRYPSQLSGGMQQRVGLARALTCDTEILMMDEAFSALDPLIRSDMQDLLLELQKELHKTIVFITHDLEEALKIGDRIAILNGGELVQHGTTQEIIMTPADDYVKDFVKKVNRSHVLQTKSVMTDQKPAKTSSNITVNETDSVDSALCEMLRENADCCIVHDSGGSVVGYLNKKDIAEVVKPLEA
ncbi:quaternary amine ABC transporter ATP-binding protein [Candidatus Pseudothioglobus sp. Uisw_050_01]|jgi:glycine betaine/proline transport system ATP-binding protein|uniref:quaternary amine ABC transporter ATP-binding protein n=1 Tax=Candidatus Pseudothioglobus sp. Uisw_050_01 TaxID=3230997 RepID=UPI003A85EBAB